MIGKAVIKVHIQMIFVVSIFRQETLHGIIRVIETISESWAATALRML